MILGTISLIVSFALLGAFLIRFHHERRRLSNGVLFTFALLCLAAGLILVIAGRTDGLRIIGVIVMRVAPVIMVLVGAGLIYDGIVIAIKRGANQAAWLVWIVGAAVIVVFVFEYLYVRTEMFPSALVPLARWVLFVAVFFMIALLCFIAQTVIANIVDPTYRCEYVIVLGAGLWGDHVSRLLADRLDEGMRWRARPDVTGHLRGNDGAFDDPDLPDEIDLAAALRDVPRYLIVSGGQGPDEAVSEARAMREYLLAQGVPDEFIVVEDRSRSTIENLAFSREIMLEHAAAHGIASPQALVVTNDFHVVRAELIARKAGYPRACAAGCRTRPYYFPAAFAREFAAIIVMFKVPVLVYCALAALFVLL